MKIPFIKSMMSDRRIIIQKIINICNARAIHPDEILDVAALVADLAHSKGVNALQFISSQSSKISLLQDNESLRKQVKILEDMIETLSNDINLDDEIDVIRADGDKVGTINISESKSFKGGLNKSIPSKRPDITPEPSRGRPLRSDPKKQCPSCGNLQHKETVTCYKCGASSMRLV